jgi:hypothetical protein
VDVCGLLSESYLLIFLFVKAYSSADSSLVFPRCRIVVVDAGAGRLLLLCAMVNLASYSHPLLSLELATILGQQVIPIFKLDILGPWHPFFLLNHGLHKTDIFRL